MYRNYFPLMALGSFRDARRGGDVGRAERRGRRDARDAPQARRRSIALLGSTGSVGVSTLALVERFPERFRAVALAAGRNIELLAEQVRRHDPELVSVADEACIAELRARVPGYRGIDRHRRGRAARGRDAAGCRHRRCPRSSARSGSVPTLAAIEAGKDVALANKEVLVVAGRARDARGARARRRVCCPSTASTTRSSRRFTVTTAPRCAASS